MRSLIKSAEEKKKILSYQQAQINERVQLNFKR